MELLLFLSLLSGVSLPGVRGQTVAGRQLLLADGDVLQVSSLDGPGLLLGQQLPDDGVHSCREKKTWGIEKLPPTPDHHLVTADLFWSLTWRIGPSGGWRDS